MDEAVIMMSDSRFSKKNIQGKLEKERDSGTKLFIICNDCCMVYAGVSHIAEKCVEQLRRKLSEQRQPNSATSLKIAQKTFNDVYTHEVALMPLVSESPRLFILVGVCSNQGRAELYYFSYGNGFMPEVVTGCKALGWSEITERFDRLLDTEVDRQLGDNIPFRHQQPEIRPASWLPVIAFKAEKAAIIFTATLSNIVAVDEYKTIGGMIQCAIITKQGIIHLPEISYTTDPTNEGPGWTRVTAKPEELTSVRGISGVIESSTLAI